MTLEHIHDAVTLHVVIRIRKRLKVDSKRCALDGILAPFPSALGVRGIPEVKFQRSNNTWDFSNPSENVHKQHDGVTVKSVLLPVTFIKANQFGNISFYRRIGGA